MMRLADTKKILLGVCGGIAAYKTAMVVSRLVQDGHDVQVVMTESATKFVGKATFQALTGKSVITCTFDTAFPLGAHIELAREYDLLCIAPATANMIGKMAHGISEELMSTLYLCFQGNVLLAPAMNCEMWEAPAVQRNVNRLEQDGVRMIGPNEGWLSCRVQGRGRMAEPEEIIAAITSTLENPG